MFNKIFYQNISTWGLVFKSVLQGTWWFNRILIRILGLWVMVFFTSKSMGHVLILAILAFTAWLLLGLLSSPRRRTIELDPIWWSKWGKILFFWERRGSAGCGSVDPSAGWRSLAEQSQTNPSSLKRYFISRHETMDTGYSHYIYVLPVALGPCRPLL
jgi:hypothetical protein